MMNFDVQVFRVMLSAKGVVVRTEEGEQVFGFVRNEYVRAQNKEDAIERAKHKVEEKVRNNTAISLSADSLDLTVDEVEEGLPIWKLASNESFVFFPCDDDAGT